MKLFLLGALCLAPLAPVGAAPAPPFIPVAAPDDEAAVNKLFERAARVYGEADAVKMNYSTAIKMDGDNLTARGVLIFEAPAKFRFEHTLLGEKSVFVYDGYTLTMLDEGKPRRVMIRPNETVWDALPDASLPDPLIATFLAGENPLDDFIGGATISKLPQQTIDGAPCDGARIASDPITISAYFNRATGALQRVVTVTEEATVTSTYAKFEVDPVLAPDTFTLTMGAAKTTAF